VKKNFIASAALAAAGLLVLSACAGAAEEAEAPAAEAPAATEEASALSGSFGLDGSSTVGPFSEVAAELFMEANPGVTITVAQSGTGGGFEKFCNGETIGSNASRPIKEEEIALCEENGIVYDFVTVAQDALAIVVNGENPLQCITVDQAKAIWEDGSTVTTWAQSGVDVPADFGSGEIVLYGPGADSGTFDFFIEEIIGDDRSINTNYRDIGEDDNAAVEGVKGDVNAMAFIPLSYFIEAESRGDVKGLEIDAGDGCVAPTGDNVIANTYLPLGRSLFTYATADAINRPEILAFFEFMITENEAITELAEFVPLTEAQKTEQLAKIAGLKG
jgi:phosphate transport system substrate-binding protein